MLFTITACKDNGNYYYKLIVNNPMWFTSLYVTCNIKLVEVTAVFSGIYFKTDFFLPSWNNGLKKKAYINWNFQFWCRNHTIPKLCWLHCQSCIVTVPLFVEKLYKCGPLIILDVICTLTKEVHVGYCAKVFGKHEEILQSKKAFKMGRHLIGS